MKKVFVVILHYGNLNVTKRCILSLQKNEQGISQIVLVNNESKLVTPKDLSYKHVKIINNKKNLGFAGGVNAGIRYAMEHGADYILLLNNDCLVTKPFINGIIEYAQINKKIGIIGPAIEFKKAEKILFDIGGGVNFLTGRTKHKEVENVKEYMPRRVTYITGAAMFIKREVFERIGFFDEHFFLYYEDVDFCLRARKVGFETWVVPQVSIFHLLSTSAGRLSQLSVYHQTKSALIFGKKYLKSPLQKLFNKLFILLQTILITVKNPKAGLAGWRAILLQ